MTVVVYELNDDAEYEELGSHTDQEAVENDDLLDIFPEQVWQDHSDEWLSERIDGPYVMAAIQDEDSETTEKISMWTPYVGPNGGEGYQHMLTDEVRYVDEEPTDDEAPGNDVDVDEPESGELNEMTGISDASYIEDNLPVTATWENDDGESFVGQIEEVDYGGFDEKFVIAATNGRRYEVNGDDLTGYIEPTPEYNPESDEEDGRIRDGFERIKEKLGEGVIPPRPTPNMGNGGSRPEQSDFRQIASEDDAEKLQQIIDTGDTGNIQVGIEAVGDGVDYGPWDADTDNLNYFDGGQFTNIDVEMPVEDFLATQTDMLSSDRNHPQEAYESFHRVRTDDVEEYAEVLQNEPGEMPMPYIEFGRNGNMRNSQEGRHRALAARMAGLDTMPVRFVLNPDRDGKGAEDRVDWGQDLSKPVEKRTKWRPYLGPRGGEGWIKPFSFTDDKIVYDEEPPGEVSPEYSEDYWHDRPSPVNEDIVNLVDSHLEGVRARPYKLDEPTADFFEEGLEAGYHPNAVSEAAEWKLKSMEKEIGDGGRLEENDVQKVLRDAATQFLDRQTEQEIEIEGGKRGGGVISLGEIDNNFKRDWWDNFESEIGYTDDQMTNEKPAYSAIRNWSITSSMFSQSTAPLIKAAMRESDNDFIPVNGEEVRETDVTDREIEHVLEYKEAMTELYRSVYGDTVPCFRGIDGQSSQIDGMREDIQEGKGIELPEATLSSWATEPGTAMRFAGSIHTDGYSEGGVVIRQEVPVEQLFVTGDTHPGLLNNENELVVNAPEPETRYEPDNLILPSETTALEQAVWAAERANRDTDVSEEAAKAVQRALLSKQEMNQYASIAIENYDWFRQTVGEQTQPDIKSKEWIPYEGPRGGEGWQNTEDRDDIRYGLEDPPGEVAEGYEDMAEDWGAGEDAVEIPEKFEGEYAPEDITPIPGDPAEWGDEFPISEGQTLLGQNWEWDIENLWFQGSDTHVPEPRMELAIPTGVSHKFGYVSDSVKLQGMEPGWFKNPAIPSKQNKQEFVGVVGEPEPRDMSFNPTGEAANASFDLDEAAERMSQEIRDRNSWENKKAGIYAAELIEEHDPSYETLLAITRYGLESNGQSINEDRDIDDAQEIVLDGIDQHLDNEAPDHPTLKGKLSLSHADPELTEDFMSRMTPDTRETVNTAMGEWIRGQGSMVDEYTLPIYRLAAHTYENDFYPTRGDVGKLIAEADDVEAADSLEVRQERLERYRQKTVETFREVFGDTVPVFRGYDPGEQSKGKEAREALQAEDAPSEIEIRNGVANSWSTNPTVAFQFSTWNTEDYPGIVVRQELPVEQIFGSSDTTTSGRSDEAEIVAGNPEEYTNHSRDDVFLPEEFDPIEQMRWALSGIENDASEEEEKADGETLSLDWELESVDWLRRYRKMEDALTKENWTPIDVGDQRGYQHVVSGETIVSKAGIPFSNTARQAGHTPLSAVVMDSDALGKEWVPYHGPRGGEGWRNTTTENIRYGLDEAPRPAENDPDELTEENIEEADIQQSFGLMQTTANDLVEGEKLHFEVQGHPYETRVQEVTDDAIHAIDTETHREFEIPTDERGMAESGLTLASPQAVFFGHGIAGSESSWLPEEDEPSQIELEAEALRSAASTDGFGDTSYIEGFAARASELGAGRDEITNAIHGALEEHPALNTDLADEIYENGQRLLEIEESLTDKSLARSYPITPIRTMRKEWIPYRGPQDGEGWQNVNNPDDIRYGLEDPPGEVAEGYEEQAEDWGPSSDEEPDRVQGATLVDYNIPGSDKDIQVPKNFTADDLKNTIRRFRDDNEGDLLTELANVVQMQNDGNLNDKMDVLHGTAEVLGNHPEIIDQYNDLLHEEIADTPNANFDVPFGFDGVDVHNMLEDTFGPHSEIVGELEDMVLFGDVDEEKADNWITAAEGWIRNYGDRKMADKFKDTIADAELANPFSNTDEYAAQEEISDDLNPAKASRVVPISDTEASTGISADSMFIAEYDDGHRAFVTNTSHHRSERIDEVRNQGEEDAERAMAGYEAFKAAGMDVPRHERLKTEYWTVEEADGQPAREWGGEPDEAMRDQFAKLGAVAMLSGNWDMHGGNVFVTENGGLIPVDLDLSGHDMQSRDWKHTSWGRLKSLGRTLNMYEVRGDDNEVLELKRDVARATQELIEDGTADDIKSMASNVDNKDIQMAIEENVFAAKGGRLYDDRVRGDE